VIARNSASRSNHKLAALKKVSIKNKAAFAVFLDVIINIELTIKKKEKT
jgi:hypothetical protein